MRYGLPLSSFPRGGCTLKAIFHLLSGCSFFSSTSKMHFHCQLRLERPHHLFYLIVRRYRSGAINPRLGTKKMVPKWHFLYWGDKPWQIDYHTLSTITEFSTPGHYSRQYTVHTHEWPQSDVLATGSIESADHQLNHAHKSTVYSLCSRPTTKTASSSSSSNPTVTAAARPTTSARIWTMHSRRATNPYWRSLVQRPRDKSE